MVRPLRASAAAAPQKSSSFFRIGGVAAKKTLGLRARRRSFDGKLNGYNGRKKLGAAAPTTRGTETREDKDEVQKESEKSAAERRQGQVGGFGADGAAKDGDGFVWPTLFDEVDESLESCVLLYPLADLRRYVMDGRLVDRWGELMKRPRSVKDVFDAVISNSSAIDNFGCNFLKGMMSSIGERVEQSKENANNLRTIDGIVVVYRSGVENASRELTEGGSKRSLSYAIVAHPARKRITLTIRGPDLNDLTWTLDSDDVTMKTVANPMARHHKVKGTVRINTSLYEFLFQPSSRGTKDKTRKAVSEYHDMLMQVIKTTKKYPGCKLYVTGWSLGGALATLFATVASAELDSLVPKPVTCVSFGSPLVGDRHFAHLHHLLEKKGKLRHVRVSNHKDIITTTPKMSTSPPMGSLCTMDTSSDEAKAGAAGEGAAAPFRHVGINLRLNGGGNRPFEVYVPRRDDDGTFMGKMRAWSDDAQTLFEDSIFPNVAYTSEYSVYHNVWTYNERLARGKDMLECMYLNHLYEKSTTAVAAAAYFANMKKEKPVVTA